MTMAANGKIEINNSIECDRWSQHSILLTQASYIAIRSNLSLFKYYFNENNFSDIIQDQPNVACDTNIKFI